MPQCDKCQGSQVALGLLFFKTLSLSRIIFVPLTYPFLLEIFGLEANVHNVNDYSGIKI